MKEFLRKLSSRKFWMAAAGVVTGIAMAFGVEESAMATVAGAVTTLISIVTYVHTEGRVDAEHVKQAVEQVQDAVETVTRDDKTAA
ncbi:MAG: hypothetical protein RRY97_08175 [Oscillibacter sp.]